MPDPTDPTPVRAQRRGNLWVLVDSSGKKIAGGGAYTDEGKARAEAARINSSWKKAKGERGAKGMQEAFGRGRRTIDFDPAEHPRNRIGRFIEVLSKLPQGKTVKIKGPSGTVRVRNSGDEFEIEGGGKGRARYDNLSRTARGGAAEEALKRAGLEADLGMAVEVSRRLPRGAGADKPEREGLEGPFRYRSGWEGFYDPKEGRYLGMDDVYMPRDFDPDTGTTSGGERGPRGAAAEKPPGMTVGDVLRHKGASGETTTEWAKRISSQARAERRGRERARAGETDAYEAGLAEEHLARGGHEGKTDEQVAEEIHREHYRYAYADLFDYAETAEDEDWAQEQADAQREADMAALTGAVKRVRAEMKGKKKPGSKMSRRSGHDLLIEAAPPGTAVHFDPRLHPRDRLGRFSEVLRGLSVGQRSMFSGPKGRVSVVRTNTGFKVEGGKERGRTKIDTPRAAARHALERGGHEPTGMGVEAGFTRRGKRPGERDVKKGDPSVVQDVNPEEISRRAAERFGMKYEGPGSLPPVSALKGLSDDEIKRLVDRVIPQTAPFKGEPWPESDPAFKDYPRRVAEEANKRATRRYREGPGVEKPDMVGPGGMTVQQFERPERRGGASDAGEFEQGDRVRLGDGRTGVVVRKVRGGQSTFGGGPRPGDQYIEPEYGVSIDSTARGTAALGVTNAGYEQVKHSDLRYTEDELAVRRAEIETRMERAAMPTKKAMRPPPSGTTLSLSMIPNEWAIEHGYGDIRSSLYGRRGTTQERREKEDRMIFHFLYGRPPPKNFPERSAAGKQWTFKSKGTKAEREKLLNRIALVKEARKRAVAKRDHVIFTGLRREERELREALRLLEAHPMTYSFDPKLHPRNRLGQFTDVLASLTKQVRGSDVQMPHGIKVRRRGGLFDVRQGEKRIGTHAKKEKAARTALGAYEKAEAAAPPPRRKYPDIARTRRLADEMGLFAEKPEDEDRPPEIGERVVVLPENPLATNLRGRLRGRQDGQAEVQTVTSQTTRMFPSERVIYGGPGVEKPEGLPEMTLTATTGRKTKAGQAGGGTTRHYKLADGRGVAVQATARGSRYGSGERGLLVTVSAEHGGDYTTEKYTRSFDLDKTEGGWQLWEEGWGNYVGTGNPDEWQRREAGPFKTLKAAHDHALKAALDNVPLGQRTRPKAPGMDEDYVT
jgi:hypothetical protein